jgi:hypothetical protein
MRANILAIAVPALGAATFDVPILNGLVIGHITSRSSDVIEWLEIPYAPPQAHHGFGIHAASTYVG